jgi:hypothetical protein
VCGRYGRSGREEAGAQGNHHQRSGKAGGHRAAGYGLPRGLRGRSRSPSVAGDVRRRS